MARRSDHSRAEIYEMVLVESRNIVEAEGLNALTARKIANAIGYSPGTIYNVFENLDEVIIHLNGRTLDELYKELAAVELSGVPDKDMEGLLVRYLEFLESNRNLWAILFDFRLGGGRQLPDWFRDKVSGVLELVENALLPMFADGDRQKAGHSARILWAAIHGICTLAESGKLEIVTTQTQRAMVVELLSTFVSGVKSNQSR